MPPHNVLKQLFVFILGLNLYIIFVIVFNKGLADYDLWGYLSFGRIFWEEGFFPYHDVFAYTPTKPVWIYHEWLTGVFFFGLIQYLGPASLQLLRYILAILTIYLIYETALKKGANRLYALIVLIVSVLIISFGYVPVRAQIFTFFFFILTLYMLESSKKTGNRNILMWLPPIQILWCNFHGGFVAGLGLIFLYALGESITHKKIAFSYLQWGIIASLATLINPYGIQYWLYTLYAVALPRPEITEWYSVVKALKSNIHIFPVSLFLIMSVIILLLSVFRKKKDITELLVIAVVIYLGMSHIRHEVLFGLVLGAYMPLYLTEYAGQWKVQEKSFKSLAVVFTIFFFCSLSFYLYSAKEIHLSPTFKFAVTADYYPTKAIAWMKERNIKGNILPHFEWGEYLMWSCYPDCRVAMDGRYENVYTDTVQKEYFDFLHGRDGGHIFLQKYPHDIVLLKSGTKTTLLMKQAKDWHVVYSDQTSVVFMKTNLKNKML
ncbi:MAG: hypothetical protein WBN66_08320 [Smithella sp.]